MHLGLHLPIKPSQNACILLIYGVQMTKSHTMKPKVVSNAIAVKKIYNYIYEKNILLCYFIPVAGILKLGSPDHRWVQIDVVLRSSVLLSPLPCPSCWRKGSRFPSCHPSELQVTLLIHVLL